MSGRLAGKVALVTGAGSGIGQATAELFAREGAAVAVVDVDDRGVRETVEAIEAAGNEALAIPTDVADRTAVATAAGSASSSTTAADLPPSSRLTRLRSAAHAAATALPAAVEPVNETLSTPGWPMS